MKSLYQTGLTNYNAIDKTGLTNYNAILFIYLFYSFVKSMFTANATLVNKVRLMTGPEGHKHLL